MKEARRAGLEHETCLVKGIWEVCGLSRCRHFAECMSKEKAKLGKYKSERITVDGIKFDSKHEARRYGELKMLERGKAIKGLQLQVTYPLIVNGILVAKYRADFVYNDISGAVIVEDAKGFRTPAYKIKKKLMLALYGVKIKEV